MKFEGKLLKNFKILQNQIKTISYTLYHYYKGKYYNNNKIMGRELLGFLYKIYTFSQQKYDRRARFFIYMISHSKMT